MDDDEQRGRLIVELFAGLDTDRVARLLAGGAEPLGFGNLMGHADARQRSRWLAPAMTTLGD
jgi:hypothetical protein